MWPTLRRLGNMTQWRKASHAGSLQDGGGLKASSLTGSYAPLGHSQALLLVASAPLRPGIPPWERLQARDLLHCFLGDLCPQQ